MNKKLLTAMMLTALSFAACSDDTFDFGNTLTQEADILDISATDYQVTTRVRVMPIMLTLQVPIPAR